jgi:hypothetical protein
MLARKNYAGGLRLAIILSNVAGSINNPSLRILKFNSTALFLPLK